MKKNIFCFLRMFLLHSFIMIGLISYNAIELKAQPCPINIVPIGTAGHVGIECQTPPMPPDKKLTIGGNGGCPDVAMELRYEPEVPYWGILALTTPGNYNLYSMITPNPNGNRGDMVLSAIESKNIVLTTRDRTGKIRFATTPALPAPLFDVERMTIWPNGKIMINPLPNDAVIPNGTLDIRLEPALTPMQNISFIADDTLNPEICFYRTHGGAEPSHSWRIGMEKDHYINYTFKSCIDVIVPGSSDDINGANDKLHNLVEFQNNGSVVFSGPDVDPGNRNSYRPLGAGTRFYWERQKAALRAGSVNGTQWDFDNLGMYSTAFGQNNIASGESSVAFGLRNKASERYASCLGGYDNISSGYASTTWGELDTADNEHATAFGLQCRASGAVSTAIGWKVKALQPECIGLGTIINLDHGGRAIAIGNDLDSIGNFSQAFGSFTRASGNHATAMGSLVSTNQKDGSFIIGDQDGGSSQTFYTYSNNNNQMTMRFQGLINNIGSDNECFRLITRETKDSGENGLYLFRNGHGWLGLSDRNMKDSIEEVNSDEILSKIMNVPVSTWRWKADSVYSDSVLVYDSLSYRWLRPMAQDFYREFPIGVPDSTLLSESVMRGVTFAGVQALKKITDTLITNQDMNWHNSGDSIITGHFLGTTNDQPLIIKTNSIERIRIDNEQITMTFSGTGIDTSEEGAALRIYSDTTQTTGVFIASEESGWRTISDRNKKEDFRNVNNDQILKSINRIPVNTWKYKNISKDIRYIGPMAQDVYSEFHLGGKDSLSINSIIFDGINFAGIKALIEKTDDLKDTLDSKVSIESFNSIRDSINDRQNELEKNIYEKLSINDFISFKDSISCYKDVCNLKDELKAKLSELQARIDSLEAKSIAPQDDKSGSDQIQSNNKYDDIILEQNNPNPFAESTTVNYYIPSKYSGFARIRLSDEIGNHNYQEFSINTGKPGQVTISAKELVTGVYNYSIEINGQVLSSKKMMVIK